MGMLLFVKGMVTVAVIGQTNASLVTLRH